MCILQTYTDSFHSVLFVCLSDILHFPRDATFFQIKMFLWFFTSFNNLCSVPAPPDSSHIPNTTISFYIVSPFTEMNCIVNVFRIYKALWGVCCIACLKNIFVWKIYTYFQRLLVLAYGKFSCVPLEYQTYFLLHDGIAKVCCCRPSLPQLSSCQGNVWETIFQVKMSS